MTGGLKADNDGAEYSYNVLQAVKLIFDSPIISSLSSFIRRACMDSSINVWIPGEHPGENAMYGFRPLLAPPQRGIASVKVWHGLPLHASSARCGRPGQYLTGGYLGR